MFTRDFYDWELEELHIFMKSIYSARIKSGDPDKVVWNPSKRRSFEVKSNYQILSSSS